MKTLLATILALGASLAQANTIYPLQTPTDLPQGNQPAGRYCVGHVFNAGDTVSGTCQSLVAFGSRLPTYRATVYAAVWNSTGVKLADVFCGTAVINRTGPPTWTYEPGHDASNCYLPTPTSYEPVLIDNVWYGYITTSPDGAYELLTLGHNGVVNQF